jgi:hypothetical protein
VWHHARLAGDPHGKGRPRFGVAGLGELGFGGADGEFASARSVTASVKIFSRTLLRSLARKELTSTSPGRPIIVSESSSKRRTMRLGDLHAALVIAYEHALAGPGGVG